MQWMQESPPAVSGPGLLAELPEDLRERLSVEMRRRSLAPGEALALEDEPCPGLCIVETGLVKIFKTSAGGREQVLLLARPGESFADAAALTGDRMPASVVAVDPTTVRILPAATLERLLAEDTRFARAVIRHLSRQLQHVVQLVEDLSFRHVQGRVAKVLLQACQPRQGIGAGIGRRPMTRFDIAEMAGTAREVVSRTLGVFEERGLIRIAHGQIELLDAKGLEALV
ncbi:MAG TPA: Crp/Fnr family transcriptional regulator [Chloroflexota bacterium]|nr:Crp/Fnr family transcriptional regulator [Chloroflexota bacterium]